MSKKEQHQLKSLKKKLNDAFTRQDRVYGILERARDNAVDLLWSDKPVSVDRLNKFVATINNNLPKLNAASKVAEEISQKLTQLTVSA